MNQKMLSILLLLILAGIVAWLFKDEIQDRYSGGESNDIGSASPETTDTNDLAQEQADKIANGTAHNFTVSDAENSLKLLANGSEFDTQTLQNIEKIYRYETGDFTSTQYKWTGTAGMLKQGWGTIYGYNIGDMPNIPIRGGSAGNVFYRYVIFPSVLDSMKFLGRYIKANGVGRWNSTDSTKAQIYANVVAQEKNQFV